MSRQEWLVWGAETAAARPDLAKAVAEFVSLDVPLGVEAARWLREEALVNDGSTRTWLLVGEERIEGYFALCAGQVDLTATDVATLGLPSGRHRLPAIVLAWIARHRDTAVSGGALIEIAYGIAQRVSQQIGAVAFALDPGDDAVARVWRGEPYGFRPAGSGNRLWIPLSLEA
ncbi:MAG TPA: hypothetical protein VGW10_10875 [Solirubrobacteraceae bacterium]|nr:hypothetical protein [Solirubrobacteraceae bacterium]